MVRKVMLRPDLQPQKANHRTCLFSLTALKALEMLGFGSQMDKLCNAPVETQDIWFEYKFAEVSHPNCGELIHTITAPNAGKGNVHRYVSLNTCQSGQDIFTDLRLITYIILRAQFLDALIEAVPKKYCNFDHRFIDCKQSLVLTHYSGTARSDLLILIRPGMRK
jgi:hypothetical protein